MDNGSQAVTTSYGQLIGVITVKRFNVVYGRTVKRVDGYAKTRVEAARRLLDLAVVKEAR